MSNSNDVTLGQLVGFFDGKKTNIGCIIGAIAVGYVHFTGTKIPGVDFADSNWLSLEYAFAMGIFGRDAIRKLQGALEGMGGESVIAKIAAAIIEANANKAKDDAAKPSA